jgi:hypothetical protein
MKKSINISGPSTTLPRGRQRRCYLLEELLVAARFDLAAIPSERRRGRIASSAASSHSTAKPPAVVLTTYPSMRSAASDCLEFFNRIRTRAPTGTRSGQRRRAPLTLRSHRSPWAVTPCESSTTTCAARATRVPQRCSILCPYTFVWPGPIFRPGGNATIEHSQGFHRLLSFGNNDLRLKGYWYLWRDLGAGASAPDCLGDTNVLESV